MLFRKITEDKCLKGEKTRIHSHIQRTAAMYVECWIDFVSRSTTNNYFPQHRGKLSVKMLQRSKIPLEAAPVNCEEYDWLGPTHLFVKAFTRYNN